MGIHPEEGFSSPRDSYLGMDPPSRGRADTEKPRRKAPKECFDSLKGGGLMAPAFQQ